MKFVTVRELRSKTATIRKDLAEAKEIVLTANGHPFALMTPLEPDTVEQELQVIRRARARAAVERLRTRAKATGVDRLGSEGINVEIAAARRARRRGR